MVLVSNQSSSTIPKRTSRLDTIKLLLDKNVAYGREVEQMELDRNVRQWGNHMGPRYVVVHGRQGVGKSSLVKSMKQSWKASVEEHDGFNALFVSATFEIHDEIMSSSGGGSGSGGGGHRSALVEALEELCRTWSLTPNGSQEIEGYLARVEEEEETTHRSIPGLCQPKWGSGGGGGGAFLNKNTQMWSISVESLEGKTCLYRKKLAIHLLLSSICRPHRPVVLFLDDFHCADEVSIDILNFLLQYNCEKAPLQRGLVIILAYRDEQQSSIAVSSSQHANVSACPCLQAVHEWRSSTHHNIRSLLVRDFCVYGTSEMLYGTLNRNDGETTSLAEVVYHKTGGNPFSICQFFRLLQDEGYLFYSLRTYRWEWSDVDHIREATSIVSEDVADIITSNIRNLPRDTQGVLMVASCLGRRIPFQILKHFFDDDCESEELMTEGSSLVISEIDPNKVEDILECAMQLEILTKKTNAATTYHWSHDKVRDAVYAMISKHECAKWHVRLGKIAWKMQSLNPDQEWLVYMAHRQFTRVSSHVSDKKMRVSLTRLNLEAAELCISKSALHPAGRMLHDSINLLDPKTRWRDHYGLCYKLHARLVEITCKLGNFEAAKRVAAAVLRHARTRHDKTRVNLALVQFAAVGPDRDYDAAINQTLDMLAEEGVKIPANPIMPQLLAMTARLMTCPQCL